MLIDTLGCIISARATEFGRVASQFASLLGGSSSPAGFAYLDGWLADAMDFNEGYSGSHFGSGAVAVAAALARARATDVTGKDFLLAVAADYELGGRIQEAMGSYYTTIDGKQAFAPVWGIATPIVYYATGAATRALRFEPALTARAWGLAGSNSPIPIGAKWSVAVDLPNTKNCDAGWCSLAGGDGRLVGTLRLHRPNQPAGRTEAPFARIRARASHRPGVDRPHRSQGGKRDPRAALHQPGATHLRQPAEQHAACSGNAAASPRWPHVAALRRKVTMSQHREPWPEQGPKRPCSVKLTAGSRSWFAETLQNDSQPPDTAWDDARVTGQVHVARRACRSLAHRRRGDGHRERRFAHRAARVVRERRSHKVSQR